MATFEAVIQTDQAWAQRAPEERFNIASEWFDANVKTQEAFQKGTPEDQAADYQNFLSKYQLQPPRNQLQPPRNQLNPLDALKGFAQEGLAQATFQGYNAPAPQTMAEQVGQFGGNIFGGISNPLTGAAVGAGIGSFIPGLGAAAGAGIGAGLGLFAGGAASQFDAYRNAGVQANPFAVGLSGAANVAMPALGRRLTQAGAPFLQQVVTDASLGALGAGATDAAIQGAEGRGFDPMRTIQVAATGAGLGAAPATIARSTPMLQQAYQQANRKKFAPKPVRALPVQPPDALPPVDMPSFPTQPKMLQGRISNQDTAFDALRQSTALAPVDAAPPVISTGSKDSRFATNTVTDSPNTAPDVADNINAQYTPTSNQARLEQASKNIADDPNDVLRRVNDLNLLDDQTVVDGQMLASFAQQQGRFEEAIDILSKLSLKLSKAGQTIQAATLWNKLTPDGAVYWANKVMMQRGLKMSREQAVKVRTQAEKVQQATGHAKSAETAKLVSMIDNLAPKTAGQKLAAYQTIAQLLNPKTTIRNLGGNELFGAAELVSDHVAVLADKLVGVFTGKRTKVLPQYKTAVTGKVRGLLQGVGDVADNIDTSGNKTQFDMGTSQTFQSGVMAKLEKGLGFTLRATDRAYYEATYRESLMNQLGATKKSGQKNPRITPEMRLTAYQEAMYRTFQDESLAAQTLMFVKNGLNKVGVQGFGLGELLLKYPKTPGNLLARGLDYSPVGFAKSMYELSKLVRGKEFNQREFVQQFGRATVGTSGMAAGYYLRKLGIVTADRNEDNDIANVQQTQGAGQYRINVSALKRFTTTLNPLDAQVKPGDTLVTYDWAQPSSIALAAGANLADNQGKKGEEQAVALLDEVAATLTQGANTLVEQPVLQGIQQVAKNREGLVSGVASTALSGASGFVPTALNQVNQLADNTVRDTTATGPVSQAINQIQAKIPFLAQMLPERRDAFGEAQERYQDGGNNPFNVFLNPSFASKAKADPVAQEVLKLYARTGEVRQAPSVVGKTVQLSMNGKEASYKLSNQERSDYQRVMGKTIKAGLDQAVQKPQFQALSDEAKIKYMAGVASAANSATKAYLFGHSPKRPDQQAIAMYQAIQQRDSEKRFYLKHNKNPNLKRQPHQKAEPNRR